MAQTKQQKEIIGLVALLLVGAMVWFGFLGKGRAVSGFFPRAYTPINVEDYGKPFRDLEATRATEYKSSGRNIFVAAPPPPPPTPQVAVVPPPYPIQGPHPDPPPPPPTLDMKFFGLGTLPSPGPRRAFLQDGDEVHIVGEGDTVRNHIRITHIGNDRIEYEDTRTGMKNSTPLEIPPSS
jgi:hypothetical protein